jgi:hypothetical protein
MRDTETYPYYFGKLLQDNDYRYCVINAGVQGYAFDQEYIYFLELLQNPIRPTFVIWTLENGDVTNSLTNNLVTYKNGKIIVQGARKNPLYIEGLITNSLVKMFPNSKLLNFITYSLQNSMSDDKYWLKEQTMFPYLLQDVFQITKTKGIHMLFVYIPDQTVISNTQDGSLVGYAYLTKQLYKYPNNAIDANQNISSSLPMIFAPDDNHLTATGNAMFAQIVFEKAKSFIYKE